MRKKLISLTLIISFILGLFSMSYAEEPDFELLTKLGINIDFTDDTSAVTRKELAEIAISLMGLQISARGEAVFFDVPEKHKDFAIINTVYQNGLMSGYTDMTFRPDNAANTTDAAGIMISMLGYGGALKSLGKERYNEICMALANNAGIYDGVTGGVLTKNKLAKMFLNMLEAEEADMLMEDDIAFDYVGGGETYITSKYGLTVVRGILQSVGEASVLNADVSGYGRISIDGENYNDGGLDLINYLGHRVKAVVDEESGTILSVKSLEREPEELIVPAENIISYDSFILNYYNEKDAVKQEKISPNSRIILNGKNAAYSEDIFSPVAGSIRLTSENESGEYETVIITSEVYVRVNSLSEQTLTDGITQKKINLENKDVAVFADGEKGGTSSLAVGMFAKVSADAMTVTDDGLIWIDNEKSDVITITVLPGESIIGKVTGYSGEEMFVDGEGYETSLYLEKLLDAGILKKPSITAEITLQLNEDGKLIYFTADSMFGADKGLEYGYLLHFGFDTDEEKFIATVVNTKAERVTLNGSENCRLNGQKLDRNRFKDSTGSNMDLYVDGEIRRQLVMYKVNANGEISNIYTAKDYANQYLLDSSGIATTVVNPTYKESGFNGYDDENFSLDFAASASLFRAGFNHLYYFGDKTISFVVPKNPYDLKRYNILLQDAKGAFAYDNNYSVSIYNVTDSFEIGVILQDNSIIENSEVRDLEYNVYGGKNQTHIITKKELAWDEDEEALRARFNVDNFIHNSDGTMRSSVLMCQDDERTDTDTKYKVFPGISFASLEPGDLIHYALDSSGLVERFRIVFRISSMYKSDGSVNYRKLNSSSMEHSIVGCLSRVVKINPDGSLILSYSQTDEFTSLYRASRTEQSYLFDMKNKRGEKLDFSQIEVGDIVFTRSESGTVREIFVYR